MKKLSIISLILVFITTPVFAGGIVTNSNQSAEFIRTMNRNASTDMDAVYYNPAGLTKLGDGFHLYLSNQTITQTRTIVADHPEYNSNTFEGETFAPVFPNIYLAYKTGNLALSAGLTPIGGGGSAEFNKGLPSFDYLLARLVGLPAKLVSPALADYGIINGYGLKASFAGSSVYLGGQLGVSYAIHDMVSLAVGFRLVSSTNTYEGSLSNVILNAENGDIAGVIPDINVDAKRTGSTFTGIVGLNLSPMDKLNLGFRYEHLSKMEMENDTKVDDTELVLDEPMFPDGAIINADMPGMIAVGAAYQIVPQLKSELSFTYYLNTAVNWDGQEENVKNGNEIGVAFEYSLSDVLAASIGFLHSTSGAEDRYQSDMSYSLNSSSIGLGAKYSLSSNLAVTLGFSNTFYEDSPNDFDLPKQKETYEKTAMVFALGFQYTR